MDFNFEEAIDKVKTTLKKIPAWGWAVIAGTVVLLYMIFTPRQVAPGIVRATSGGGAPVGLGGGSGESLSAGTDGVLSQLAENIKNAENVNKELKTDYDTLSTNFNRISTEFNSYQTNTAKVLDETSKNFNTLSNALAFETARANIPNIHFDGKEDFEQYRSISDSIKLSSFREDEKKLLIQKSAGLGNDGIADPNYKGPTKTLADIKSDPNALKTAVELTNNIIANRKEAGLSTANQEKWLNQLQSK
jgi:formiminotetrahydrofolate cyclodeaminase